MTSLFTPFAIGDLVLPNRIVMSPLTRSRAGDSRIPNALMTRYYVQRAEAGLIISEGAGVDPMGLGYAQTPGIWSKEQVEGWKNVTTAIHQADGRIFLQLWHVGRISDPSFLNGAQPLAPSAIAASGHVNLLRPKRAFVTPQAMNVKQIKDVVGQFRRGAENAQAAGFDGVEIHGANGYLIDQFLQDGSNVRNDEYGGSIENRTRFLEEIVDAVTSVWGASRVGLHIAPRCDSNGAGDSDPKALFSHVATEMGKRKLAFLFARECVADDSIGPLLKSLFGGPYIANEKLTKESAEELLSSGKADLLAFGKDYISNPDLVERFRRNAPLNAFDQQTFYSGEEKGYVDYPALEN